MSSRHAVRSTIDPVTGKKIYTRTYNSWRSMKKRCYWPGAVDWAYYGALGVTVCEKWQDFDGFYEDMGERPDGKTLDRVDPHGNYESSNCEWADDFQQARNKRKNVAPRA